MGTDSLFRIAGPRLLPPLPCGKGVSPHFSAVSCFFMRFCILACGVVCLYGQSTAPTPRVRLMRPLVRGTHAAVSSMKPEATIVAQHILDAGGNAFDAAVAGQAVLALVDAENNGVG